MRATTNSSPPRAQQRGKEIGKDLPQTCAEEPGASGGKDVLELRAEEHRQDMPAIRAEEGLDILQPRTPGAEAWDLFRALFAMHRRRFLVAAGEFDLHPAQAGALLQLAAPMPMNALATRLACDNSNVTGIIDRLEARRLVTRRLDPEDRRVKHVVLTASGRRLRDQLLERIGSPPDGFERLADGDLRQLRDILRRMLSEAK
ncbi:MAG: MarR family winged helix-turn-helix transcriptional regulator [Solirubrobacteraceae bacterium]